jgi:hypothetical protein
MLSSSARPRPQPSVPIVQKPEDQLSFAIVVVKVEFHHANEPLFADPLENTKNLDFERNGSAVQPVVSKGQ